MKAAEIIIESESPGPVTVRVNDQIVPAASIPLWIRTALVSFARRSERDPSLPKPAWPDTAKARSVP